MAGSTAVEACAAKLGDAVDGDPAEVCQWLLENRESVEQAEDILTDLSVEFVSAVDNPAQPSDWILAKSASEEPEWSVDAPIVLKSDFDEDDQRVAFAPVLIPGAVDKQGDVVPPMEIEQAAHDYIKYHRKVDADHDLLDGKGEVVESYTLKDDRDFEMPDGRSKTYPEGTWVLGVEFTDDETWARVKSGDLSGFSIYGGARSLDPEDTLSEKSMTDDTSEETVDAETDTEQEQEVESKDSNEDETEEETEKTCDCQCSECGDDASTDTEEKDAEVGVSKEELAEVVEQAVTAALDSREDTEEKEADEQAEKNTDDEPADEEQEKSVDRRASRRPADDEADSTTIDYSGIFN